MPTLSASLTIMHPLEIGFDASKYLVGFVLPEFGDQPLLGLLISLAIIAAVYAVTQGYDVVRHGARTIRGSECDPVISRHLVPESRRATTDRAAAVEVVKSALPVAGSHSVGETALACHTPMRYGPGGSLITPLPPARSLPGKKANTIWIPFCPLAGLLGMVFAMLFIVLTIALFVCVVVAPACRACLPPVLLQPSSLRSPRPIRVGSSTFTRVFCGATSARTAQPVLVSCMSPEIFQRRGQFCATLSAKFISRSWRGTIANAIANGTASFTKRVIAILVSLVFVKLIQRQQAAIGVNTLIFAAALLEGSRIVHDVFLSSNSRMASAGGGINRSSGATLADVLNIIPQRVTS